MASSGTPAWSGPPPRRVVVIGTSGAGKSTLAGPLARRLGAPHIELDGLQHGPQWTQTPVAEFQAKVAARAAEPSWVFDGNYIDKVSATLWPMADLIVWVDTALPVLLPRLVRRSLRRILGRTELWHGNRERWSALFGRHSVLAWAVTSHRRHRRELPGRLAELAGCGVRSVRLRTAGQAAAFLATVPAASDPDRADTEGAR